MGELVDINSKKPHSSGRLVCLGCKHEWQAVWPNTEECFPEFECPQCGMSKGVPLGLFVPAELMRVCKCGCIHFCIDEDHQALCAHCGTVQEF